MVGATTTSRTVVNRRAGCAGRRERKVLVAVRCVVGKVRATAIERAGLLNIQLGGLVMADEFELGSTLCASRARDVVSSVQRQWVRATALTQGTSTTTNVPVESRCHLAPYRWPLGSSLMCHATAGPLATASRHEPHLLPKQPSPACDRAVVGTAATDTGSGPCSMVTPKYRRM